MSADEFLERVTAMNENTNADEVVKLYDEWAETYKDQVSIRDMCTPLLIRTSLAPSLRGRRSLLGVKIQPRALRAEANLDPKRLFFLRGVFEREGLWD